LVKDEVVKQGEAVSFAANADTHIVESYKPLKNDLWYSPKEFNDIKQRNTSEIKKAHISIIDIQFRPGVYRGLERLTDENRQMNMFRSIQVVLMEQDRQQCRGKSQQSLDENLIALSELYQAYCICSVQKAQRLAAMDSQEAN
jgi:hypothetical protein